jgi:hypothetical protein
MDSTDGDRWIDPDIQMRSRFLFLVVETLCYLMHACVRIDCIRFSQACSAIVIYVSFVFM